MNVESGMMTEAHSPPRLYRQLPLSRPAPTESGFRERGPKLLKRRGEWCASERFSVVRLVVDKG